MVGTVESDNVSLLTSHDDNFFDVPEYGNVLPEIPEEIETILDVDNFGKPLNPYSAEEYGILYGKQSMLDSEFSAPACPPSFTARYLEPTLSKNEYTRLTKLWYFTRGLRHDRDVLQKLDQIVDMVKQSLEWEFGILGFVEMDTFTRLATAGTMPLAVIPRRESPCSHTVVQEAGTVFTVTDMKKDWRFQQSPTAEFGGLRSYAGTQIYLTRHGEESVAFGSLCVASRSVQKPLTEGQKRALLRGANMISRELVARNRLRRLNERQAMAETLTRLRSTDTQESDEEAILHAMGNHYPGDNVFVAQILANKVNLAKDKPMDLEKVQEGLWEDKDLIETTVTTGKSAQQACGRPVRAVLGYIAGEERCLAVTSHDMTRVFDDLDVWFVDQCAQVIKNVQQAKYLRDALKAKERFLSSIRHELRTPIHGILSSVELLTEELKSRNLIEAEFSPGDSSVEALLRTIRYSGTELMTTVNNILRLNAISSSANAALTVDLLYDLRFIEHDLLGEVLGSCSEDALMGLSLRFEDNLTEQASVVVDWEMLKEILKALVFNAIAATHSGTITVTTTYDLSQELLTFDVIDTGTGIGKEDHEKIFIAFEKLNEHSKGAGLGLSLASLMASSLRGTLMLVSSEPGAGSHFRLEIPQVQPASKSSLRPVRRSLIRDTRHLPITFYIQPQSSRNLHLLSHVERHLTARGMSKGEDPTASLIVVNEPDPLKNYCNPAIQHLKSPHPVLVVTSSPPGDSLRSTFLETLEPNLAFPITGPLHTSRLDEVLIDVDEAVCKLSQRPQPTPQQSLENQSITQSISTISSDSSTSNGTSEATPPATPALELERLSMQTSLSRSIKVLLVDDNKINLSVLQFYCKKRQISHTSALNGNEAVTLFRDSVSNSKDLADSFTLILMDLQMPVCDGVEATKQIRAYEEQNNLPKSTIFMITGQDSVADRKASFGAGCDEFFCKPVSMKRLSQAISQHFPDAPVK